MADKISGKNIINYVAIILVVFMCLPLANALCAGSMFPSSMRGPSLSLLPYLDFFVDHTGSMDIEEVAAAERRDQYRPYLDKSLPDGSGTLWLRFMLSPSLETRKAQLLFLDMGSGIPGTPVLYDAIVNNLSGMAEWRETLPDQGNILILPEGGQEATTCYIRLDGLPGQWFDPTVRTPQNAATDWAGMARPAAVLALAVVMLLCLLRGISEHGQWRYWTAIYVGVALAQGIMGIPATGSGHISLAGAWSVLAPGVALMLLPHVGRHLMNTQAKARSIDIQLMLLSLPGAVLALVPLLPQCVWLTRHIDMWPLCTIFFVPTALGAWIMGLGGSRRFLLGCILPPLFVSIGILGKIFDVDVNILASTPLWGTALSALLLAATSTPHGVIVHSDAEKQEQKSGQKQVHDSPIVLQDLLDDPNLRLVLPNEIDSNEKQPHLDKASAPLPKFATDEGKIGIDDVSIKPAVSLDDAGLKSAGELVGALELQDRDYGQSVHQDTVQPGQGNLLLENSLRAPIEDLLREGAVISQCALPPAARQSAEKMYSAARKMSELVSNKSGIASTEVVNDSTISPFNLQHIMRDVHDSFSVVAENAGIAFSWSMPPHIGQMYLGHGDALAAVLAQLVESAVRATSDGSVRFSVRNVPESNEPGHLLFAISDTGSGMPPEKRSGLAIVRAWELVAAHRGSLDLSCSDAGTNISFTLHLQLYESEDAVKKDDVVLPDIFGHGARQASCVAGNHVQSSVKNEDKVEYCEKQEAMNIHPGLDKEIPSLSSLAETFAAMSLTDIVAKNDTDISTRSLSENAFGNHNGLSEQVQTLQDEQPAANTDAGFYDPYESVPDILPAGLTDGQYKIPDPVQDLAGQPVQVEGHGVATCSDLVNKQGGVPDFVSGCERSNEVDKHTDLEAVSKAVDSGVNPAIVLSGPEYDDSLNTNRASELSSETKQLHLPNIQTDNVTLQDQTESAMDDFMDVGQKTGVGIAQSGANDFGHISGQDVSINVTAEDQASQSFRETSFASTDFEEWVGDPVPAGSPLPKDDGIQQMSEISSITMQPKQGKAGNNLEENNYLSVHAEKPLLWPDAAESGDKMENNEENRSEELQEQSTVVAHSAHSGASKLLRNSVAAPRRWPQFTLRPMRADEHTGHDTVQSSYSSPSLSPAGEWVGEPQPIQQSVEDFGRSVQQAGMAQAAGAKNGEAESCLANNQPGENTNAPIETGISSATASVGSQDRALQELLGHLDDNINKARQGLGIQNCNMVADSAKNIAGEADGFGLRVLARLARCVEQAARANDLSAVRDLLPDLIVAVERTNITLASHQ